MQAAEEAGDLLDWWKWGGWKLVTLSLKGIGYPGYSPGQQIKTVRTLLSVTIATESINMNL